MCSVFHNAEVPSPRHRSPASVSTFLLVAATLAVAQNARASDYGSWRRESVEAFAQAVGSRREAVDVCHRDTSNGEGPRLPTHIVLRLVVDQEGATLVRIEARTRLDRRFERCLIRALSGVVLPGHDHPRSRILHLDWLFRSDGPVWPRPILGGERRHVGVE